MDVQRSSGDLFRVMVPAAAWEVLQNHRRCLGSMHS